MSFVDRLVAQVVHLEVALMHAYARLEARTDSEALHDIRINLRRLRSLLRPLRKLEAVNALEQAATLLARLTTPTRDLEVLAAELQRQGYSVQAERRLLAVQQDYDKILLSSASKQLFVQLDQWPATLRTAERAGELAKIRKTIARHQRKCIKALRQALTDQLYDRHQLRLLVKHARYSNEAYPRLSPLAPAASASLKSLQNLLGNWHDHFQWCLQASQQDDLQTLALAWQTAGASALQEAEKAVRTLTQRLHCTD